VGPELAWLIYLYPFLVGCYDILFIIIMHQNLKFIIFSSFFFFFLDYV